MKTEACKLYSRVFRTFLPNLIKIDPYNFKLYRLKVRFLDEVYKYLYMRKYARINNYAPR